MSIPDLSGDVRRQISLDPPRFRGVLHSWCVPISIVLGIVAIAISPTTTSRIFMTVYSLTLTAMFLFSALFHRLRWTDRGWWRMRQLDHTGIYLVIAGSFTGIAGLALEGAPRAVLLAAVWVVSALGILYRWRPIVPRFGLTTALMALVGALVVPFLPRLLDGLGGLGMTLLLVGCGVYFVGALALGARVPDPWPKTFGYHEVWHVLVVAAAGLHWLVAVLYAIPAAERIASGG